VAPHPSNLKGALLGLAAMGLFACSDIVIKFLGSGYNAFQIIFFAGLMSVPLIAGFAMADPAQEGLRPRQPRLMALRCLIVLINGILGTYAFASLPLAQYYAIFFTMPIFITLLAVPVLGEKIDALRGAAVIAGLIGVVVALDPARSVLQRGHAAALAGSVFGAANYVIIRKTGGQERVVVMVLYPLMLQLLVAAIVLPLVYQPMPFRDLALSALMATVSFVGYLLIIAAYRRAPGIVVAPMQYSQIIWAGIFGAVLFGEHLTRQTLLGIALIIAAGVAIVARQDRPA
jgi:S-adenosylmethionine uptake transporter